MQLVVGNVCSGGILCSVADIHSEMTDYFTQKVTVDLLDICGLFTDIGSRLLGGIRNAASLW